jgi:UDP-N-acetylmuramate dehydrogenase
MLDALIDEIRKIRDITLLENEPMSRHTTFKIGGPIRALVYPNSFEALEHLMKLTGSSGITPLLLGNGSNLLCSDEPITRIAICTRPDGSGYSPYMEPLGGGALIASSGALLSQLAMLALSESLSGMEFAAGIPGTLGGAVRMNAGAYGGEMKDIVSSVETITSDGKHKTYKNSDLQFSYRHSIFSNNDTEIIAKVTVKLQRGDRDVIQAEMRKLSNQRKAKQPLDLPSAGSTFKRPEGYYAAELIDKAGLKGYTVGAVQVSEKHAGFVVNRGGATYRDVMSVIEHVQSEVLKQFGIELEPEVLPVT